MFTILTFYVVTAAVAALFVIDAGIQLSRIDGFSAFMLGHLAGQARRAGEAIAAGDYDWQRFYNVDISASFDAITPLNRQRYSREWAQFLVYKDNV